MSLHKSLKKKIKFGQNNVLSRIEKVKYLKEKGVWKIRDKVTGFAKIKIDRRKKEKKIKKEVDEVVNKEI